jgi:predicted RNA-binding protein YlxR (DUF448 family)
MSPKVKKIPLRMCLGCQELKSKKELLRVVKNKEGEISIDGTGKKPGRGAYICRNKECFLKARKTKRLERTFEQAISEDLYQTLQNELEELDGK